VYVFVFVCVLARSCVFVCRGHCARRPFVFVKITQQSRLS
jgi:hypothetical protein